MTAALAQKALGSENVFGVLMPNDNALCITGKPYDTLHDIIYGENIGSLKDYGINFDNIVSPFPNFHILQKNIQLFKKNHVTMHFSQVNGIRGGDFSEMRAYMIGKLMWNPDADADSLMHTFMDGYYGDAGHYLYQYQKIMQGALLASGLPLWIYDSPISHKKGMLNPHLMEVYNELFDLEFFDEIESGTDAVIKWHPINRATSTNSIIIGESECSVSKEAYKKLAHMIEEQSEPNISSWLIYSSGTSVALAYSTDFAFLEAVEQFIENYGELKRFAPTSGVLLSDSFSLFKIPNILVFLIIKI